MKKAVLDAGGWSDPYANCNDVSDKDLTESASSLQSPAKASTNPQAKPPNAPPPLVANAKVFKQIENGKIFLVVDNSASDHAVAVGYTADYQDSTGKWYNKLSGETHVAKRSIFRQELWNQDAQDWRVQMTGQRAEGP